MQAHFRQDIQGLRAVAVTLVALDHAAVGPFHGGFIGVDVFFVISGYLITSLLLREADKTGHISLSSFYARRARRILPAALLVTLATILLAVLFLDGARALSVGEQAIWVTFFAANIKFAAEETDYFAEGAPASPLQHYWSLAVEEQYYLFWPLILIGAIALLAGWLKGPRRAAIAVLVVIITASFAWSVHQTAQDPTAAYFSTPARAYELAIGALAAAVTPYLARFWRSYLPFLLALASWVGVAMIGYSALVYTPQTPFPGSAAAVPVVGTALLLLGGRERVAAWGPQRALSVLPMRLVGDWSYSFYLWHWPVIIVARYQFGGISGWRGLAVLGVALALSAATYYWVETPFRTRKVWSKGHTRALLLYPATIAIVLPSVAVANHVVRAGSNDGGAAITVTNYGQDDSDKPRRFSDDPYVALVQASVLAAENEMEVPGGLRPSPLDLVDSVASTDDCPYFDLKTKDLELCPRGDTEGDKQMVLIGDSHARQWIPALEQIAEDHGYVAYFLVREGCPAADVVPWKKTGGGSVGCPEFQDWAVEQVQDLEPDLTVLATDANERGFTDDEGNQVGDEAGIEAFLESGLVDTIEQVKPSSGKTVVIGDPPIHTVGPVECITRDDPTLLGCLGPPQERSIRMMRATERAAETAGADFVYTADWFCARDLCPTVIGQFITHRDDEHITVEYAEYLAPELARLMGFPPAD
ncbi:acyltransferase [Nocardioides szechwanensis]|uniref:Peptidoglycan/LPS O-acetylase OafA/YrhL, contains acyltransferase and SGNH-hydrolase domains n=1 Tax=Nocardioides szechwanensis TaxID=1005944 RepID=A0A1H0IHX8_9ACTN|nr:acyltransferase family protein [Nocardioides szechwanensis]GEP34517.1 acyltransferase [Nocardioides szechwanensis]SDO31079.1 Peptidoglycan/LPS O-acetylase OafA/YrhL, contains acyltransferase and SGNH-hydrolase domains [Nocardioides szechwanensis]